MEHRAENCEDNCYGQIECESINREQQSYPKPRHNDASNVALIYERAAKVSMNRTFEPFNIADRGRYVEVKTVSKYPTLLRRAHLSQNTHGNVSG